MADAAGRHLFFSNRGSEIDIAAPGIAVLSAWPGGTTNFSGTSAAVPFVSAAIAAVLSEHNNLTAREAADLVIAQASDSGQPGFDKELGNGLLDLGRVMESGTPGIHDIAAMVPTIKRDDNGNIVVVLSAQNRGTERIEIADMNITLNSSVHNAVFLDIQPGATISREIIHNPAPGISGNTISIQMSVEIRGQADKYPANNTTSARITLRTE